MRFFFGMLGIVVGFLMVWKTQFFLQTFGRIPWAEEHLRHGWGGSWMGYKLLGLIIIFGSLLYMMGVLQRMIILVIGPFFGVGIE
jgi:hypothetical protein